MASTIPTVIANDTPEPAAGAPPSSAPTTIPDKLSKLQRRIKNTSSVRFEAARRVRFNYHLAQITVVILSLWVITISYALAMNMQQFGIGQERLQAVGILLPVFIVAFSLIENGETYLKSHQLELNARQLRELSDQLYTEIAKMQEKGRDHSKVFGIYSQRYNDMLERTPVNHENIDHWTRACWVERDNSPRFSLDWWYFSAASLYYWLVRQMRRAFYALLWLGPAIIFAL